jgi:hypothetical protein
MPIRRILILLLPLAVAACDDLPTEAALDPSVVATELGLRARVPSYARGTLLREAVRAVAIEDGASMLWRRTAELRAQDAAARAARDAGQMDAQLEAESARRAAELVFIASTLGDARLDDVQRDVRVALEDLQGRVAMVRASGHDVTRAAALLADAERLLAASAAGAPSRVEALGAALDAGDVLQRAQQLLDAVTRVRTLDDLFAEVLSDVRRESGADAGRALLAHYQTYVREAEQAMASRDRERAHDRLKRVRAEQLRIITQRLGSGGVADYIAEVTAAEAVLQMPDRHQRALAREHTIQAEQALRQGRLDVALERAALAAELISALPIAPR